MRIVEPYSRKFCRAKGASCGSVMPVREVMGKCKFALAMLCNPSLNVGKSGVARFIRNWGSILTPDHHFLFTINLPTGAILVDSLIRYTLDLAD